MNSSMKSLCESKQIENSQLTDYLKKLQAEKHRLSEKTNALKKALEEEEKMHRTYAAEAAANEAIQIEAFKKERLALMKEKKSLVTCNRQLVKDLSFYKKACEEILTKSVTSSHTNSTLGSSYKLRSGSTSESKTILDEAPRSECKHKNLKAKFQESKKLPHSVGSTTKTNKNTYTPEVLAMLGHLANNKI